PISRRRRFVRRRGQPRRGDGRGQPDAYIPTLSVRPVLPVCRICAENVGGFVIFLSGLNDPASYRTVPGAQDVRTPPLARRNRGVDQPLTPQTAPLARHAAHLRSAWRSKTISPRADSQ